MKRLDTLFLTLICLLLSGCIEDDMARSAMGEGMVPISLTIAPSAASTRTVSTDLQSSQLDNGQAFYAYFTSSDVVPQSTTFTADGSGGTTPATQPYFRLSETTTDVRAYYPSSVTEGTAQFSVQPDQSSDADYMASDLMFASATVPKVYPTSSAALTFAHKMAKIRVNTTTRASSIKAIKLKGILPTVPFTASTGAIGTAEGSATDVTMYSSSGMTSDISCVALVPPQSFAADATLIEIVTSVHGAGDPLVYKLPAAITFASGNQYIFNVDLHEEQLTVTSTVTAWGDGATNTATCHFTIDYSGIAVGDIIYQDGTWSKPSGVSERKALGDTPIAVVFSINPTAYDRDVNQNGIGNFTHGYAMALKEDVNDVGYQWATALPTSIVTDAFIPADGNVSVANWNSTISKDYDGLKHCNAIKAKINSGTYTEEDFPAYACTRNHTPEAPYTSSGWYLPSIGQQFLWLTNLGGAVSLGSPKNNKYLSAPYEYVYWESVTEPVRSAINTYLSTGHCLLTTGDDFTPFVGGADNTSGGCLYYSSTECKVGNAYFLSFYHPGAWLSCGCSYPETGRRRARAVFAF